MRSYDIKNIALGEICSFTQGVQIPDSETNKYPREGYIRYLYIRDFFSDKFKTYVRDICPTKIMSEKDIMMVNTGNTAGDVYRGKVGVLCNNAFRISVKKKYREHVSIEYLWQYLTSDLRNRQSQRLFNSGGQPHVGHKNVARLKFPLMDIDVQQKISVILSTWDIAIELTEKLIQAKTQLKKGLMQKLLMNKMRFKEFKGARWKEISLGFVARVNMGQSPESEFYNENQEGLPLIQGNADCRNRRTIPTTYTSQITKRAELGDIIMSVRAPVGAISKCEHDACIGRGVCAIRGEKINNDYLYQYLVFFEPRWSTFAQGSTFTAVNSDDIRKLKLTVPVDGKEQKKIARALSTVDQVVEYMTIKLEALRRQKKGLMQKLLTGKIRVRV